MTGSGSQSEVNDRNVMGIAFEDLSEEDQRRIKE
jgi:hypothetical protein